MGSRRIVPVLVLALLATALGGLVAAPAASAQLDQQTLARCAAYNTAVATGGQRAATAAEQLRDEANPRGITNALMIIVNAESNIAPSGSRPSPEAIDAAIGALRAYFIPLCMRTAADTCRLVIAAVAEEDSGSAALLRDLEAPASEGLDTALAVLAGEITVAQSAFHTTRADAVAQVQERYGCPAVVDPPSTVDRCETDCGARRASFQLAFTGPSTATPLATLGTALIASGALVLAARRRLDR